MVDFFYRVHFLDKTCLFISIYLLYLNVSFLQAKLLMYTIVLEMLVLVPSYVIKVISSYCERDRKIEATLRKSEYKTIFDQSHTYWFFLSKNTDKCDWKTLPNLFECRDTLLFIVSALCRHACFMEYTFYFLKYSCKLLKWWHFQELPL